MVVPAHPPAVGWWVSRIPVPTRWVSRIPLLSDDHSGFRVWWVSYIPPGFRARTWVSRIHVPRNEPSGCPVFTVFTPRNASLQYRIRQGGGLRSSSCHVPG